MDVPWRYGLKNIFFRNKTFLFFKIESWNFQVQFEIKIREISQNFNSFSLFRQLLLSSFFYRLSDWVEILQGFMKFNFKLNLKVSAFYLEKQKSFIPRKKIKPSSISKQKSFLYRLNFPKGFGSYYVFLKSTRVKCPWLKFPSLQRGHFNSWLKIFMIEIYGVETWKVILG